MAPVIAPNCRTLDCLRLKRFLDESVEMVAGLPDQVLRVVVSGDLLNSLTSVRDDGVGLTFRSETSGNPDEQRDKR